MALVEGARSRTGSFFRNACASERKIFMKQNRCPIRLNHHVYPLVVGSTDKITFENWETSGSTVQLTAWTEIPQENILWRSSNPEVAPVSDGLVRGRTTGSAVISACLPSGEEDCCQILVIDNITRNTVLRLRLNAEQLTLSCGAHAVLHPLIEPEDTLGNGAMNRNVLFFSDNEAVASVDASGQVRALAPGDACVRAVSADVGRTARCRIHVTGEIQAQKGQQTVPEYSSIESILLTAGEYRRLPISPSLALASSRPDVADVSADGTLTAYSCGQASLYVTALQGGFCRQIPVRVQAPASAPREIRLNQEELYLKEGETFELYGLAFPASFPEVSFSWETDRPELLSFREKKKNCFGAETVSIHALRAGNAHVTIRLGQLTARCRVIIEASGNTTSFSGQADTAFRSGSKFVPLEAASIPEEKHCPQNIPVPEEKSCLQNVHIPAESISTDTVTMYWNRNCLPDIPRFDRYEALLRRRGETGWHRDAFTRKLAHTFRSLLPDTDYEFRILALDSDGRTLAEASVCARTRRLNAVLDVTAPPYLASGNGFHNDTLAIQRAIEDCPPGGEVLLPFGHIFLCGALFLKSDMTFRVDGILLGSPDPKDYPPIITRWEGWRKLEQKASEWPNSTPELPDNHMAHASLLNAGVYDEGGSTHPGPCRLKNLVICGSGMINGNGFRLAYNEGPNHHSVGGGRPVPFSTRQDPTLRGRCILLQNEQNVCVRDLTVCYGPSWTIHAIYCEHVSFEHLQIISKGDGTTGAADDICILNGDGIDPDSSRHVQIFDCVFHTGDDAVAIKSGRNREGNELDLPSAHIRVTDCESSDSKGGFCIGSEQAGGAHDILWQNLTVSRISLFGLWVKSCAARGGLVERIVWRDCILTDTQGAVFLEDAYHSSNANPAKVLPEVCHQTFENIRCTGTHAFGIRIVGLEEKPIHDISFRAVSFESLPADGKLFTLRNTERISFRQITCSTSPS